MFGYGFRASSTVVRRITAVSEPFGDDSEYRGRRWSTPTVGRQAFVGVAAVRSLHTGAFRLPPLASVLLRRQTLVQRDEERPRNKVRPNADEDVDVLSQPHQHTHLSRSERRDAQRVLSRRRA
jgi:hypothetical protein